MKFLHTWEEARAMAELVKKRGGVVVTTNGCFDVLHPGHVQYLTEARAQGDVLLVGLNSDTSVQKIKGPGRPLNNENSRAIVVGALKCVDGVCIFNEDTPLKWLEMIRPDVHVKGGDYKVEDLPEKKLLDSWGGKIHLAPHYPGHSTTEFIKKSQGRS
jgi:rfaE bifunctional protein nucleotidyltransferase chain/domain